MYRMKIIVAQRRSSTQSFAVPRHNQEVLARPERAITPRFEAFYDWDRFKRSSTMLYIIYQEDQDDSIAAAAIRKKIKPEHLAYLDRHESKLVLGGAMLAEDGIKRTGSTLIINVGSLAEAEAFSREEPFRKAGLFKSVKISRMRRGQWNPSAAPKTAEGN